MSSKMEWVGSPDKMVVTELCIETIHLEINRWEGRMLNCGPQVMDRYSGWNLVEFLFDLLLFLSESSKLNSQLI